MSCNRHFTRLDACEQSLKHHAEHALSAFCIGVNGLQLIHCEKAKLDMSVSARNNQSCAAW